MRRCLRVLPVLLVASACAPARPANHRSAGASVTASPAASSERLPPGDRAAVERVVDGDTIVVRLGGRSVKVRLIGVDTPETVDPRRPVGCFGREASAFVKHLLSGGQVLLAYDVEPRDRYGRTLAYVYLLDGTFVNLSLVAGGYATTLTIPPNVAHAEQFLAAQRDARSRGLGLWNPAACPRVTAP